MTVNIEITSAGIYDHILYVLWETRGEEEQRKGQAHDLRLSTPAGA